MIHNKSLEAFHCSQTFLPGGVNSPVRAFTSLGGTPPFIASGKGACMTDVDGNIYIDFCQSWGALILGHAHPKIIKTVQKAVARGTSFGTPTKRETHLAELIVSAMPSIEKIRFVNSGTEATMSAIRLARAFTKRDKIIKFDGCYHGHADHLLVNAGSGASAGVPEAFLRETMSIPFNNPDAVRDAFAHHGHDIAAVIVEPVPANMGVVLPKPGFLEMLRELTQRHGALLIFDEVITGFRLGWSGAQGHFNIQPDLTCLGKIIGGGFPVGAYGGRQDIMDLLAPLGPVYQAGTLSGNPVAMTAGITTLEILSQSGFYEKLDQQAGQFIAQLQDILAGASYAEPIKPIKPTQPIQLNAIGSMFTIFFSEHPVIDFQSAQQCDAKQFAKVYHKLLENGVYFSPSSMEGNFISAVHTKEDLDKAIQNIKNVLG